MDQYFNIKVYDSFQHLLRELPKENPGLIAYSFMTPHTMEVFQEIQILRKKTNNQFLLIAGGPHVVGNPEGTLKMGFDAVSSGEGEETLPKICHAFLEKGTEIRGKIFSNSNPTLLENSMPISEIISMMAPLEITRGCFWNCQFCQTSRAKPRHRSLESIGEYLDELVRRNYLQRVGFICPSGFEYGTKKPGSMQSHLLETILSMSKERNIQFIEYGIFPSELRPNTIQPKLLNLIRRYCANRKVTIGAQSGSDATLKRLRRGHTTQDIRSAAAHSREAGLTPLLDFIVGFPAETEEEQIQTLELAQHLHRKYHARTQLHFFMALSGTPLENQIPSFLNQRVQAKLEELYRAGVCTDWWKEGMALSRKIINFQHQIQRLRQRIEKLS